MVITVVPGGILLIADMARKFTIDVSMDYISCPYPPGARENHSEIVYHHNINIADKHVVLVDDAIESGSTMKRIVAHIQDHYQPASVSIATLLVKPSRVEIAVPQYYACEMETDYLLVGYGLPWQDKRRNLPQIAKVIIE